MKFRMFNVKNVILSMILCGTTSFSFLYADNLKECESLEEKVQGCVLKTYYDNGNLEEETPYKNDKEEGTRRFYYKSGKLASELSYRNGKREGIAKKYFENGNLWIEISFENDSVKNARIDYYESGDILAEIPYNADDNINGIIKAYDKGKNLIWQANAQNGKLISGKCISGKVMTNAHLMKLTSDINGFQSDSHYWNSICEK